MCDRQENSRDGNGIRALNTGDLSLYRALRLAALQAAPTAFGSSYEDESAYPESVFASRLEQADGNIVFGAFSGENLVGVAGMLRRQRRSEHHRGTLVGVYVDPQARGFQLGRRLVERVIAHAAKHVVILDARVVSDNEPAKRIYRELGFITYGVEPKSLFVQGRYFDQELISMDFSDPVHAVATRRSNSDRQITQ